MSSHERAEAQITKTAHHNDDSSNALRNEYFESACSRSGGAKHESNLLDLPKLAIDSFSNELKKEGKQIWDGLDSNPTTHFIKHDYCNDEPVKVGIAVAGMVGVGAIAAVAAAPELAAAGAAYEIGTVATAIAGTANVLLAIDYQNRHH